MTTEAKKLTDAELAEIRELLPHWAEQHGGWKARKLVNHIDALTAENKAQQAELAKLKSCEGVDVEKLAKESWSEYVSIGKEKGWLVQKWENMDESYREGATRFVRHIVSQLPLCQPRPLDDAEVERLAEGAREIRLAGSLPMTWEDAGEDIREGYRRAVRYLAAELPAAESAELGNICTPLATALGYSPASAQVQGVCVNREMAERVVAEAVSKLAELRAKLEAAERDADAGHRRADANYRVACQDLNRISADRDRLADSVVMETQARTEQQERADRLAAELAAAKRELDGKTARLEAFERSPDDKQKIIWQLEEEVNEAESRGNELYRQLDAAKRELEDFKHYASRTELAIVAYDAFAAQLKASGEWHSGTKFDDLQFGRKEAWNAASYAAVRAYKLSQSRDAEHYKGILERVLRFAACDGDGEINWETIEETLISYLRGLEGNADHFGEQLAATQAKLDGLVRACEPFKSYFTSMPDGEIPDYCAALSCGNSLLTVGELRGFVSALAAAKRDAPAETKQPAGDRRNAYIMSFEGVAYLVFGDDAEEAARKIPGPGDGISVHHSIPCESDEGYRINTNFGGVLLRHADGTPLGGEPYCRSYRERILQRTCETDANKMVDAEQPAFVCPKCEGVEYCELESGGIACDSVSNHRQCECLWTGTWADVRAAREPAQPTGWAWAAWWERQVGE